MKRIAWVFLLGANLLLLSCAHFRAEAPQGFAAYKNDPPFRAVSADGVIYRVSSERHKPEAGLDFWKEALALRMRDAGYQAVDSLDLTVGKYPAWGVQLEAPLGVSDQSYLIVAIPAGKRLIVVEAAGDSPRFAVHRDAILAAIREIRIP